MPHDFERFRDVPASCTCTWRWEQSLFRWFRTERNPYCIWHVSREKQ